MRKLSWVVVYLCALGVTAVAQEQDFSKIQSRITKVAGNIYMIDGTGGFAGANTAAVPGGSSISFGTDSALATGADAGSR